MSQHRSSQPPGRFGRADVARLGRYLREQRHGRSHSLRALAEMSGLSVGTIRALEAGQGSPSLATVLAVVEALGLDLDRAVEAARAGRRVAAVHRAGSDAGPSLAGAALSLSVSELAAWRAEPALASGASHPSMGFVVEGSVLAVDRGGARYRLGAGDAYHAQPGAVQGLAGAGEGRVLHVVDTRRVAERAPGSAGQCAEEK